MAITVSFACNDPNNGNFLGGFEKLGVDAGELHMELEGDMYDLVRVNFDFPVTNGGGTVKVGRIKVPGLAYKSWYGNWCWDAAWFSWVEALRIINYVGKLKHWRMVDGPSDLFEAFNDRHEITPMEWKKNNEMRRS
jgi:hypothetical protein